MAWRKTEVLRVWQCLLPTAREDNVFTSVCHSVHNRPHVYSVTAHPCYSTVGTHPTGMLSCLCLLVILSILFHILKKECVITSNYRQI